MLSSGVAVGQMDELKSFTNEMDGWIDGVLETLSWTRQGLLEVSYPVQLRVQLLMK